MESVVRDEMRRFSGVNTSPLVATLDSYTKELWISYSGEVKARLYTTGWMISLRGLKV